LEKTVADPRIVKLAKVLVDYCVGVKPGDLVIMSSEFDGKPLLVEAYRQVVRAGGLPFVTWFDDELREIMLKEGNDDQLKHIAEPVKYVMENYDCHISVMAPTNSRTMSNVDPERQTIARSAGRELMETSMKRAAAGEYRWTLTQFPTNSGAQDADMSLSDFEDFVYGATFADTDDAVVEWKKLSAMQEKLVNWLEGKDQLKVQGPSVDLTLSVAGRTFENSDGHQNMPSGEIFTGPVEDSVNGWVRFSYPAIVGGREVSGVELRFEDGKVVKASAEKNEEFLMSMLDTDEGARYLGEFAIGTNFGITKFTKSILFDEKIGGTIHMALGGGYPETGSKNKSAIHWDMISEMRDGGKIFVDGELFYDSGKFTILE
jgi:aminopeptidase